MAARPESRTTPPVWLAIGFRPFFLLAAAWVLFAGLTMVFAFAGLPWPAEAPALARWHGHEMLYGFVAAAIAGFLLTAVATWTSRPPLSGGALLGLVALWLLGRLVMLPWLGLDATPWVFVDVLFLPALGIAVAASLLPTRNRRNYPFLVLIGLLTLLNLAFHARQSGWAGPAGFDPLRVTVDVVTLVVALVAGRIVPLFTRNALLREGVDLRPAAAPRLEQASFLALVAVVIVDVLAPASRTAGLVAAIAGVLLAARLAGWQGHRTLRLPLVWILHAGYAWLALGLLLKAALLAAAQPWAVYWLHALTAGAFGTMILGVMTRVALGHTGRPLVVAPSIVVAYVLVIAGALLRVFAPALWPTGFHALVPVAMLAWMAGFALFLVVYLPILLAPRTDAAG